MPYTTHMDEPKQFEVVSTKGNTPQTLGTITVADSKLEFSPKSLGQMFADVYIGTSSGVKSTDDGLDFLRAWPTYSRSGYIVIKPKEPSGR